MSLFEVNRNTSFLGNGGSSNKQPRSLTQMLESNIDEINEGYTPQEKPWEQITKAGKKFAAGQPLMTILSERLDEIDQGQKPPYDPQEAVKGLQTASYKPLVTLAQNQAGGGAGGMISDADYAQQAPTNTYGRRVGNSLHTGDTQGANNTFDNAQRDPHAQDMLGRVTMYGQHPEEYSKYAADSTKWPHVQTLTPIVSGVTKGAADAVTPVVEASGKMANWKWGETELGNRAADFGDAIKKLEGAYDEAKNTYPTLSQDGQLTPLGEVVDKGEQTAGAMTEAFITQTIPGLAQFNNTYNAAKAADRVYDETRAAFDAEDAASGHWRHAAEKDSLAYKEALLTGISHLLSPLPLSKAKGLSSADTDGRLTKVTQNAVTAQGKQYSKDIIRRLIESLIQSSEWDQEHF